MIVLDEEAYRWYLLEEDACLFLYAVCSHSAVDYLFLMKLDETEMAAFREKGRSYLSDLAYKIHYSAPGVQGNKSPYRTRSLVMTPEMKRADAALDVWNAKRAELDVGAGQ